MRMNITATTPVGNRSQDYTSLRCIREEWQATTYNATAQARLSILLLNPRADLWTA